MKPTLSSQYCIVMVTRARGSSAGRAELYTKHTNTTFSSADIRLPMSSIAGLNARSNCACDDAVFRAWRCFNRRCSRVMSAGISGTNKLLSMVAVMDLPTTSYQSRPKREDVPVSASFNGDGRLATALHDACKLVNLDRDTCESMRNVCLSDAHSQRGTPRQR